MNKNNIALLIGITVIGLLSILILLTSNQKSRTSQKSQAATGEQIDTLKYLLGKHYVGSSDPKSLSQTDYLVGNSLYSVKWEGGYEYRTWDGSAIYLKQDSSVGKFDIPGLNGVVATSYKLDPGTWMNRYMSVGQHLFVANKVDWYDDKCNIVKTWPVWNYINTLEDHKTMDFGGVVGVQDAIVLKYDYSTGFEKFYYAKDWGWVRWEAYDGATGKMTNHTEINGSHNFILLKTKCIPQPDIKIPNAPPPPPPGKQACYNDCFSKTGNSSGCTAVCATKSDCWDGCSVKNTACLNSCLHPTTTPPPPTPSPNPPPPPPTNDNSKDASFCQGRGDTPACYDCNGDGVVNIIDFSCFSKNFNKGT